MSSAVEKLEALLARVQRNRAQPRVAQVVATRVAEPNEPPRAMTPAKAPEAPKPVAEPPRAMTPAKAPEAPKPVAEPPRAMTPAKAPEAPKPVAEPPRAPEPEVRVESVGPSLEEPISEVRDLGEPPPPERKKPSSPLELAVESSVEMPLGHDEDEVPTAVAPVSATPDAPVAAKSESVAPTPAAPMAAAKVAAKPESVAPTPAAPMATAKVPEIAIEEPASPETLEPERIAVSAPQAAVPVAKLASAFVASKPATFGELLDRTLHLKIR